MQDGKIYDSSDENDEGILIPVSGEKPSSGVLNYSNNKFTTGNLVIGDYKVTFNENGTVTTEKNTGLSSTEQENGGGETSQGGESQTYTVYSLGEEVTVGGEKFFVIAEDDSSKSKVTLLAKYNLNQDGTEQLQKGSNYTKCIFSSNPYWFDDAFDYYFVGKEMWDIKDEVDGLERELGDGPGTDYYTWLGTVEDIPNEWSPDSGMTRAEAFEYSPDWDETIFPQDWYWKGDEFDISSVSGYSEGDAIKKAKDYANAKESGAIGRLLTFEEAELIENGDNDNLKTILYGKYTGTDKVPGAGFLKFWLSTPLFKAYGLYLIECGILNGQGSDFHFTSARYDTSDAGVRPVIEISKTSIE